MKKIIYVWFPHFCANAVVSKQISTKAAMMLPLLLQLVLGAPGKKSIQALREGLNKSLVRLTERGAGVVGWSG